MSTVEIRNNFHRLIDNIDNENILSKFYHIIERVSKIKDGQLWDRLTEVEKKELLLVDNETVDKSSLIPHSMMQQKHKRLI